MGKIIYILGVLASIWCVLDILKKNVSLIYKVLLMVLVLCTSWVGLAIYYFLLRDRI